MFIPYSKDATDSFFLHPYNRKGGDYKHSDNAYLFFFLAGVGFIPQERYKKLKLRRIMKSIYRRFTYGFLKIEVICEADKADIELAGYHNHLYKAYGEYLNEDLILKAERKNVNQNKKE